MPNEDCPICLERLNTADELFILPCYECEYNFCTKCVKTFLQSTKDDFQEASDGSRQVKVHMACPQCRGKYSMDVSEIVMLREAYSLGISLVNDDGDHIADSDLNATQLARKRDFMSYSKKRQVECAYGLYMKVMKDGNMSIPEELTSEALRVFDILFHQVEDGENGTTFEGQPSSSVLKPVSIDETLFQGLGECMGSDEKLFLTQLLTSGKAEKLAQAAMIMNGILKLSLSGHALSSNEPFDGKAHARKTERIAQIKKQFPLPNHMPGYFLVPLFDKRQKHLQLQDGTWNGKMVPPTPSKRVFDTIYEKHYKAKPESRPVVTVRGVRGPVGRLGLRKGDAITHVNDIEWVGTAEELVDHLHQHFAQNPSDLISITVNANPETAEFLQIRAGMQERSKSQQL
eukprot:scaffold1184_cov132-Cylindrotheca_fusiformis.AAC.74